MSDWAKAKAEQLIRTYVDQINKSQYPDANLCEGMIEMAYATALITDTGYGYWKRRLELALQQRRLELRQAKHRRIIKGVTA